MSLKPLKFVFTSLANIPGSSNELVDCTELADKPTKCLQINKFLKVTVFETSFCSEPAGGVGHDVTIIA